MKYELKKLPYEYDALEPFIDKETVLIHHDKHHQAYVNNLNAALDAHPEIKDDLEALLKKPDKIPADIRVAVLNNGGGHYNHEFYWNILKVNHGNGPKGKLHDAILKAFGSFDKFKEEFSKAAKTKFGSGWAWVVVDKDLNLKIVATSNQDVPFNEGKPILTIDIWEHAYYLKYQNRRPDYVENYFQIINWDEVEKLYLKSI